MQDKTDIGSAAVAVSRQDLKRAASIAALFTSKKKKTLPVLSCAKLDVVQDDEDTSMMLQATDLDKAVVVTIPAEAKETFSMVAPAKPLVALARNMKGQAVIMQHLWVDALGLVHVSEMDNPQNIIELRATEVDDFPHLHHRVENMTKAMTLSVKISTQELVQSLHWALAHVAKPDDGHQILETVCFRLEHGCKMPYLRVNGCNHRQLVHYHMPISQHGIAPATGPQEYLLPADTAKAILQALKLQPTDFVTMQASRETAVFSWLGVQVIAPLTMGNKVGTNVFSGHYPDTDKVLFRVRNASPSYRICFDRVAMLDTIKAGQAMVRGNETMTVVVQEGIPAGSATVYFGQASLIDGTRCKMVLPDVLTYMPDDNQRFVVGFNPLYMQRMLECVTTGQVMWMQQDPEKPALFYGKYSTLTQLPACQDAQAMYLVMPKTVHAEQNMW